MNTPQNERQVPEPPGHRSSTKSTVWRGALVLLGFTPLLCAFAFWLWNRPAYRFFPLALAAAFFLLWWRRREVCFNPQPRARLTGTVLLVLAVLLLVPATLFWSPWAGAVAAFLALLGMLARVGGWPLLKWAAPGLLLLLAVIPPPLGLDVKLLGILSVRVISSASRLAYDMDVLHLATPAGVEFTTGSVPVSAAVGSLLWLPATLAFCLVALVLLRRPVWKIVLVLIGTTALTVLANVGLLLFGFWAKAHQGVEVFTGGGAITARLLLTLLSIGLMFSLDQFVMFLTEPTARSSDAAQPAAVASSTGAAAGLPSALAGGILVLGLVQLPIGLATLRVNRAAAAINQALSAGPQRFDLPATLGRWHLATTRDAAASGPGGSLPRQWVFTNGTAIAALNLNAGPLPGPDPTLSVAGLGWQPVKMLEHSSPLATNDPTLVEIELESGARRAILLSTQLSAQGEPLNLGSLASAASGRWTPAWSRKMGGHLRCLVTCTDASAPAANEARQLITTAREEVRRGLQTR